MAENMNGRGRVCFIMEDLPTSKRNPYPNGPHARILAHVIVDERRLGTVVVAAGPKDDIAAYFNGNITLKELEKRFLGDAVTADLEDQCG